MASFLRWETKSLALSSFSPPPQPNSHVFRDCADKAKFLQKSDDISKLIRNRQATDLHWERQLALGVGVDDLDHDEINKTIVHIGESEKLGEDDSVVNFLTNYGLFYNGQPTNSAVILFAKNPTRFVPQSRVRLSFLENGKTDDKFLDDKILEGNLFKNIDVIQGFFEKLYIRRM